ncbi:MAG: YqaE/Pmp3 family membrane protein [Gemmataceae bacterium]
MLTRLAVLCPPLAVLLTGKRSDALSNLGLTLLLYVPGVVHALQEVDRHATAQRYESVMRELEHS